MVDTCLDKLVLEVDRGYARGYGFTLLQKVLDPETGEYKNVPIDLTGLTVLFQVKLSPYVEVKPLIAKEITESSDEVEVGCNSVLNPGTVIGRNTNIYPLSSVRGVIKENSIYKNKNEIVEKI